MHGIETAVAVPQLVTLVKATTLRAASSGLVSRW